MCGRCSCVCVYIYIYIYIFISASPAVSCISRDELIRDVLLWIPTHGRAKAGRPARTYIQQLCEDTGCCPEDLPRAMNDREEWRERVRDIRATSAIWWDIYIYIYIYTHIHTYLRRQTISKAYSCEAKDEWIANRSWYAIKLQSNNKWRKSSDKPSEVVLTSKVIWHTYQETWRIRV